MATTAGIPGKGDRGPGLRECVRGDLAAMAALKGTRYPSFAGLVDVLTLPGTWSVLLYRFGSALHASGLRPLSRVVYFLNCVLFGVEFQFGSRVGPGLVVAHPIGTAFGNDVVMGRGVTLTGGNRLGTGGTRDKHGSPVLGDEVWMLDGAKAFGPCKIGDRAVIGVSAVVMSDVPTETIAVGIPARVLKQREDLGRPEETAGDDPAWGS